ncbi:hypothetical protein KY289_030291 [Solanum tuberosum]|nr:hypothetical protein KY289_030291 [Solanum tuberosum]
MSCDIEVCMQAGAQIPHKYKPMLKLDIVLPENEESCLVAEESRVRFLKYKTVMRLDIVLPERLAWGSHVKHVPLGGS